MRTIHEACRETVDIASACTTTHPALAAFRKMQRITAQADRLLAAQLRGHNINPPQLTVLMTIGSHEGLTQQELAEAVGLSRANISQLLDRLQEAGHITRVPVGRAYSIHLTDDSRTLLQDALPDMESVILDEFSTLSANEQQTLNTILAKLDTDSTTTG